MKRGRPAGYILRDRKALPVYDIMEWALWFETADRQVAYTEFVNPPAWKKIDVARAREQAETAKRLGMSHVTALRMAGQMIVVSTVFLGLDHAWTGGPPLLFETMIFNGPLNDFQQRCTTWDQAAAQHRQACEEVARALVGDTRLVSNDLPATDGR